MTLPDEGFEATGSITPTAPPPTPTSSTEAVKGSSETEAPSPNTSMIPDIRQSTSNPVPVVFVNPPADSDMMILNMSDKPSLEEQAEEKEEEEKGKEGDHAN